MSGALPASVLINAFMERAAEAVAAAKLMLQNGHTDFAASRAYYVAFYAASAALMKRGIEVSTHRGPITAVHKHFIRTGELTAEAGETIGSLFEARMVGDYEVLPTRMPAAEAQEAVDSAESFVSEIKALLEKEKPS